MTEPLLVVEDLRTTFHSDSGVVTAVDGVSFDVMPGEVFGIVGESGAGKSVTAMSLLGLVPQPPAKVESGRIIWKGQDLLDVAPKELRRIRGQEISIIFQDPMTSLNPVFTIGKQVAEIVRVHERISRPAAKDRAVEMLELVGIPNPKVRADQYPHEFSGGMRQRAMIAMAIACNPDLLIADEPTTALDVTVQAQVLEVLENIQELTSLAILLITHDLGVVAGIADRVMVMYAGKQVEWGSVDDVFYNPRHPYTLGLLASLPRLDERGEEVRLRPIAGQPPSLSRIPPGCAFHPRCDFRRLPDPCSTDLPVLRPIDSAGHFAACHFAEELRQTSPDQLKAVVD